MPQNEPSPYGNGRAQTRATGRYTGDPRRAPEGGKSFAITVTLSFFLGVFGADRFYLGKTSTAVIKLVTLGGVGLWWIADLVLTLIGGQRDVLGHRLAGYERDKKTVLLAAGVFLAASVSVVLVLLIIAALTGSEPSELGRRVALGIGYTAVIVAAATWVLRRIRPQQAVLRDADPVPARIRSHLSALTDLRRHYLRRATVGDEAAADVASRIDALVSDAAELFRRLRARSDRAQYALARAEYEDRLATLAEALGEDFLLDVLAHPRLWERPEERIRDVVDALESVDAQVLENIRQVNAHRGLQFRVRLDGLLAPDKALEKDWQRRFDEAEGV